MDKLKEYLLSQKLSTTIYKCSTIALFFFILCPVLSMIAYLSVNNFTDSVVSNYSFVPANIFFYTTIFVGFIGVLLTILFLLIKIVRKEKINLLVIILSLSLLLWILLCDILAKDHFVSFAGSVGRDEGFLTISSYYGFAGMTIICFQKKDNIKYLFRLFIIVSSIIAFLVLLQSCKIYIPFFEYGGKRLGLFMGPFYHPNHYGYYLTITLMANVGLFYLEKSKKVKIALLLSFALQSYALVLDNTFACFLSVMVGLICFIVFNWIRNKKTHIIDFSFIIILFVVALLVLLTPYQSVFSEFVKISKDVGDIATNTDADHAGSGRWHLWKVSFETILDHPIFGIGSDMSNPIMFDHICDRPHNEFIQYALFYGIPGFLLYFGLLVSIMLPDLINIKKIRKETFFCFIITIAYLFNSLFGNTTYYITPLFIIILVACIEKTNGTLSNDAVQTDEMDSNCINDDSQLVNDEIEINGKTAI